MGRKLRNFGVAVLSIAAFFTLINVVPPAKSVDVNPFIKGKDEKVMIAAHRGGADTNPENTLLAYRAAVNEYKVDILESDLYLTKDGYLEDFEVLTLNTTELYASKINALLSRATPRDLYDVNAMIENNVINDTELLRKCLVFYNAIGGDYDIQELDYKNIEKLDYRKYKTQLKPVISKDDKFDIEKAKEKVLAYVKDLLVLTDGEKEFLSKLH